MKNSRVRESGSKHGGDVVGDVASVLGIGDRGNLQRKESGCDKEEEKEDCVRVCGFGLWRRCRRRLH